MKLLTIIIPTYNMEKYLHNCLDSLIVDDEFMEILEVLIVNDGSKDSSSVIAHEYENKYPQTFTVIDKENGNYGSCINRGLKEANGKYLRILDADDSFVEGAVQKLLKNISFLPKDVDVVYTGYQINYVEEGRSVKILNNDLDFDNIKDLYLYSLPNFFYDNYTMHALTYNTEFLRKIEYVQQEGISYTDSEYVYYPFVVARTFVAFNIILYSYNIGREGQTVSIESMIKNQNNYLKLYNRYIMDKTYVKGNVNAVALRRNILTIIVHDMLRIYIKYSKYNHETEIRLRHVLKQVKEQDTKLYSRIIFKRIKFIYPYKLWELMGKYWFTIYHWR